MILNSTKKRLAPAAIAAGVLLAACGSATEDAGVDPAGAVVDSDGAVVATTSILADIVSNVSCGAVTVETLIPPQADPHAFEPSLADRGLLDDASLIVGNGLGLEEGLEDTVNASADAGTPVLWFGDEVDTIAYQSVTGHDHDSHDEDHDDDHDSKEDHDDHAAEEDHDDHDDHEDHEDDHDSESDEDHGDEEDHEDHEDEEDHEDHGSDEDHEDHAAEEDHDDHGHSGGADPHIWFDPIRMSDALPALADRLVADVGLDRAEVDQCTADYQAELTSLDDQIEQALSAVSDDRRKLVTNHDSLGYFADRYGFDVIGTVIPSSSSLAETNPAQLQELTEVIEAADVPAIFTEPATAQDEAQALADQIDGLSVIPLQMAGLTGEDDGAGSYIDLLLTNAEAIGGALGAEG